MSDEISLGELVRELQGSIVDLYKRVTYLEGIASVTDSLFIGIVPRLPSLGIVSPKATQHVRSKLEKLMLADLLPQQRDQVAEYLSLLKTTSNSYADSQQHTPRN